MQKREKESNYKVRIRGLHNNSWGCDKNQSKLSAGVRDRWVAVSIMEKWWFRAISHQGTKTKCKGETEQQISPPLMREKPLLSFSVTDLFPLTTHKSRQSEIREWKTGYELLECKHHRHNTVISFLWTVPSWRSLSFSSTTEAKHLNSTEETVLKARNSNVKTISIMLTDLEQNSWESKSKGSKKEKKE